MSSARKLNFTVDSALLRELGERLVSTVHVAVSELVKNAYDADATEVTVEINQGPKGKAPSIVIADNGAGMTFADVRDFWMRIGTTNKEDEPVSPIYGRPRTGSKGVGRFSCRRLGQELQLISTAKSTRHEGKLERTEVNFTWPDFKPGKAVEDVQISALVSTVSSKEGSGTELRISGAPQNEWTTSGYRFLARQLVLLSGNRGARRKGFEVDPGFLLRYKAPDGTDVDDFREKLIGGSWGTLTGRVDIKGEASFELVANGLPGGRKFRPQTRFLGIEGAKLTLGIVPTSTRTRGDFRDPDLFKKYVISELTDKWGGVQVRYNGFRMYPYGEPTDDWLKIEADRGRRQGKPSDAEMMNFAKTLPGVNPNRVLLTMLSHRSYVGQVDVDSSMASLEPKIDRQGFVRNKALESLERFTRMAVDWANIHRDDFIRRRNQENANTAAQELEILLEDRSESRRKGANESITKATSFLKSEVRRVSEYIPQAEREQTTHRLVRVTKAIDAISRANQNQISHLRTMASASNLTLLFAHEVRNALASLGSASTRANYLAKKAPEVSSDLKELAIQIDSSRSQLSDLVHLTGIVGTFSPDATLGDLNLYDAVERTAQCFRLVRNSYKIDVDYQSVPPGILVGPITDGELYTTLINITSNAIKSVIARGGRGGRVKFIASEDGDDTVLQVLDTGLGLSAEHFADAFTPFISDLGGNLYSKLKKNANPQDKEIFGSGAGLGLAISRDILRARGGEINFSNPPDGWAACVEVHLP